MAPKSSQRTSLGASQPQPFQTEINKLCQTVDDAKNSAGEIKYVQFPSTRFRPLTRCRAQTIVNKLREFLKGYRKAGKTLDPAIITEVVASLENDKGDICSRLDSAIFYTLVEIALQSGACIYGERILYLLAVSSRIPNLGSVAKFFNRHHSSMTRKILKIREPSRRERIALEKKA